MEKLTLRKTIFKSYPESHILRDPAENVHGVLIKKKHQIDFDFESFYLHMKFWTLKLRCSVSIRIDCESGPWMTKPFQNEVNSKRKLY